MPADPLRISFLYRGRDVDNGTMAVEEVAEALQGFSGAFGKIASRVTPDATHQLRISAINQSSFEMLISAWISASPSGQLQTLQSATNAAKFVFSLMMDIIRLKKHTKNQPYTVSVKGAGNTVFVISGDNNQLEVPVPAFEIFKEKLIDANLNKIVSPLQAQSIDSAELKATDEEGNILEASIGSGERDYFRPDATIETTRETEVIGRLVSLNKENSRGTFKLGNDLSVRYHFIGLDKDSFHSDFAYKGPVRASVMATFDENLVPTHFDIMSVHRLQRELPLGDSPTE